MKRYVPARKEVNGVEYKPNSTYWFDKFDCINKGMEFPVYKTIKRVVDIYYDPKDEDFGIFEVELSRGSEDNDGEYPIYNELKVVKELSKEEYASFL